MSHHIHRNLTGLEDGSKLYALYTHKHVYLMYILILWWSELSSGLSLSRLSLIPLKTLPSNSKYEQFILAKYFILPSSQQSKTVSNFIKILSNQIESKIGTKINPKDECDTTQLVNSWNTILNRECQKYIPKLSKNMFRSRAR